jgi:hypothetical protein
MPLTIRCGHVTRENKSGAPPTGRRRCGDWMPPQNLGPLARGGGKEARETTPPLLSSPRITRPPFSDIFSQQVGATVSERQ